ncbi:DNA-binding protein [Actinoalloteichus sp. AHMU CJ021]|uniref:Helicase conserved C-terminal domain-containing protein n=1 Tax=Actinoalloteichus caeruleus DSM 43889 TaxID=1120930 RepID=A0ABT1JJR0_ACTCY|nr:helicase-associated domain-containing protein [Actinoalloteichus caeruleus]AUS78469.1 DNA-binding protein [Actinoalloteichus sp. AHMU CJ021]MCP2332567.1 Helicase conserved C-terminal domain-containing protein [Actinoalloteichus caeruleus DSM 43889]
MPGTSLADWLRDQDDGTLAALLRARPDVATPPPADSSVLATRVGVRVSVARACDDLDARCLDILTALLVLDADRRPASRSELDRLLGDAVPAEPLRDSLTTLTHRALVWTVGDGAELAVVPSLREVLGPYPAGLGRSVPDLAGVDPLARVAELGEPERRLLDTLAAGPPVGATREAGSPVPTPPRTPVQRLLAAGLLVRRDSETVELPREVGLALRGSDPLPGFRGTPPVLDTAPRDAALVDATAAGAAMELGRQVEAVLRLWSADPPPILKSGGLAVRELKRVAKAVDCAEGHAALLVELAVGAGLVAASGEESGDWLLSTTADQWLSAPPELRWGALARAWLHLPRLPGRTGARDERDRALGPLSDDLRFPQAPLERVRVLDLFAGLAPGTVVRDQERAVAVLAWRAPRRGGRLRDQLARWTVEEATSLGVLALGGLSTAGRALLAEASGAPPEDEPTRLMGAAMPPPVDHVLVQADLTVVAPGPLEPGLSDMMGLVADVESAGGATVYRVTESTVRRALDAGHTAAELHDFFRTRSRTPVPQSLSYLLDDVARRHGLLRVGTAECFVRCEDPVLLAEVLSSPRTTDLGLRRIAPTVAISPLPLGDVLAELRAAGFAPAAEDTGGQLLDLRPPGRRTARRAAPGRRTVPTGALGEERVLELVAHLRAGDRAGAAQRGRTASSGVGNGTSSSAALSLLHQAVRAGRSIWIGFVDSHGTATQRVVRPVRIGGGYVEGFDQDQAACRYPLHRITSAALVED